MSEYNFPEITSPELHDARVNVVGMTYPAADKIVEVMRRYNGEHMSDVGVLLGARKGQTSIIQEVSILPNPSGPDAPYENPLPDIGKVVHEAQARDPHLRAVGLVIGPGIEEDAWTYIPHFGLYIVGGEQLHSYRPRTISDPNRYSAWTMDTNNQKIIRIPNENLRLIGAKQIAPQPPQRIVFRNVK